MSEESPGERMKEDTTNNEHDSASRFLDRKNGGCGSLVAAPAPSASLKRTSSIAVDRLEDLAQLAASVSHSNDTKIVDNPNPKIIKGKRRKKQQQQQQLPQKEVAIEGKKGRGPGGAKTKYTCKYCQNKYDHIYNLCPMKVFGEESVAKMKLDPEKSREIAKTIAQTREKQRNYKSGKNKPRGKYKCGNCGLPKTTLCHCMCKKCGRLQRAECICPERKLPSALSSSSSAKKNVQRKPTTKTMTANNKQQQQQQQQQRDEATAKLDPTILTQLKKVNQIVNGTIMQQQQQCGKNTNRAKNDQEKERVAIDVLLALPKNKHISLP